MNICNLAELGTGNLSLLLSLIMMYLCKAKTKFPCAAAYSPRQYYGSSQTSLASEKFHHDIRFEKVWKERCF